MVRAMASGVKEKGEVADGVNVVCQYRNETVGPVALDLLDGRREDFLAEFLAQLRDDVLADVAGTDVGDDRTDQCQQAESAERQQDALAEAVFRVQGVVDAGQQQGDGKAAGHAQCYGDGHDRSKGPEQGEQFANGAALGIGHSCFPDVLGRWGPRIVPWPLPAGPVGMGRLSGVAWRRLSLRHCECGRRPAPGACVTRLGLLADRRSRMPGI